MRSLNSAVTAVTERILHPDDLSHPRHPGLVYLESRLGGSYHEHPSEIDEYTQVMNHLRILAHTPEESTDLIRTRRKDLP